MSITSPSDSLSWSGGICWTCQSSSFLRRKVFSRLTSLSVFALVVLLSYSSINSSIIPSRRTNFGSSSCRFNLFFVSLFACYRKPHACFPPLWSTIDCLCLGLAIFSQSFWFVGCVFRTNFTWTFFVCINLTIDEIKSKFAVSLNLTEDQGDL